MNFFFQIFPALLAVLLFAGGVGYFYLSSKAIEAQREARASLAAHEAKMTEAADAFSRAAQEQQDLAKAAIDRVAVTPDEFQQVAQSELWPRGSIIPVEGSAIMYGGGDHIVPLASGEPYTTISVPPIVESPPIGRAFGMMTSATRLKTYGLQIKTPVASK